MIRFLLLLLMLLVFPCQSVCGADLPRGGPTWEIVEHRLSLLVHDDWQQRPQEVALVGWFQSDAKLSRVKCELQTQSGAACKGNLCSISQTLPCVVLQRSDGWVAYKASGRNVPNSAEELCAGLFRPGIRYLLPWRRPKPTPAPVPTPDVLPVPESRDVREIPAIEDTVKATPEEEFPGGLALAAILASIGGTGVVQFTKRIRSFD